jgi:hypothetical protein
MSPPYKFGHPEDDAGSLGFSCCAILPIPHSFHILGVHACCRIGKFIFVDNLIFFLNPRLPDLGQQSEQRTESSSDLHHSDGS